MTLALVIRFQWDDHPILFDVVTNVEIDMFSLLTNFAKYLNFVAPSFRLHIPPFESLMFYSYFQP
jgi:hypothetical protein